MDKPAIAYFQGAYPGQTVHIVGKGPSLSYLAREDFLDGPVLTINESILVVQELGLTNPIYSMQKDGYEWMMVRPHADIPLILQTRLSDYWFADHPLRLLVHPVDDLGFGHYAEMSIRMCVALAKVMGCGRIAFVCCDSLAGDLRGYDVRGNRIYDNGASGHYGHVVPQIWEDVKGLDTILIIPRDHAPSNG